MNRERKKHSEGMMYNMSCVGSFNTVLCGRMRRRKQRERKQRTPKNVLMCTSIV